MPDDLFAALGLPTRADLTDEEVRAAWKRIAAATHPDRDDGGDPVRFGAAAAAYNTLRTSFGRGEALADLGPPRPARRPARHARRSGGRGLTWKPGRAGGRGLTGARYLPSGGHGRRTALRAAAAAGAATAAVLAAGWTPATVGLLAGALTWTAAAIRLALPGRGDQ